MRDLDRVRRARAVQGVLAEIAIGVLVAGTIGGAIMDCGRGCEPRPAHAEAPPVVGALVEPGSVGGRVSSTPAHTPRGVEEPSHVRGYQPPATEAERAIIDRALYDCDKASARHLDVWLALRLLRVEEDAGLPERLRGLTLATWCGEAAYQIEDVVGDGGRAVGPLQLHPLLGSLCGDVEARHDPEASARCYLRHVHRVRGKAKRLCPRDDAWQVAEAAVARGRVRCGAMSGHWRRLRGWQR